SGATHSVSVIPSSFTLAPGGTMNLRVQLTVQPAATGDSGSLSGGSAGLLRQVSGMVSLVPTSGNNGVTLNVPYYLVPRGRSLDQGEVPVTFGTGPARQNTGNA